MSPVDFSVFLAGCAMLFFVLIGIGVATLAMAPKPLERPVDKAWYLRCYSTQATRRTYKSN